MYIYDADVKFEDQHLTHFRPAIRDEVRVAITKSPAKSCELDPLPTNLSKSVLECLLPLISTIIKKSLVKFDFPSYFTKAQVLSLIKKRNLDKDVLDNFRSCLRCHFY